VAVFTAAADLLLLFSSSASNYCIKNPADCM